MELSEHQMVKIPARVVGHNPTARTANLLLADGQWLTVSYDNIEGLEDAQQAVEPIVEQAVAPPVSPKPSASSEMTTS